jgi:hypothetical protein
MAITCFIGKLDSGRSCSTEGPKEPVPAGVKVKASLRCGDTGGKISEIEWTFLGRRDGKDRYHLVRRFPVDDPGVAVSTKEIEFSGERVVVFQDDVHCIVVEPPKK